MELTICTECKNFFRDESVLPRRDIWYNHLCLANREWFTTGLGVRVFPPWKLGYCGDYNDGNCKEFDPLIDPNLIE